METTQTHLPFGLHHFIAKVVQAGHGRVTKQPPGVVHPCQQACSPAIRAPMSENVHLGSPSTLACEPQLHPCPNSKTVVKDRGMSTVTAPRRRLELDTLRGRWDLLCPSTHSDQGWMVLTLLPLPGMLELGESMHKACQRIALALFLQCQCLPLS